MAKLGEQLQQQQQSDQRITRTQRVEQQQGQKKYNFLQEQAKQKQKELSGTKTIEEYEQKYNLLSPDIKQFFSSPNTLRTDKTLRIDENKLKIQDKITFANKEKENAKILYDERLAKNQRWFDRKTPDQQDKYYDRFNKNKNNYEDDYEEKVAYWNGYQKGLGKGLNELNSNKDINFNDITNYASDVGNYQENKENARNEARAFIQKEKDAVRKLEEAGYTPQVIQSSYKGNPTSVNLSYYNKSTGDWKKVKHYDIKGGVDVSKFERVAFTPAQNRTLAYAGKTYNFSTGVGIYKTPTGKIVTPYEDTGYTEQQLIKKSQDKAYTEYVKDRNTRGVYSDPTPKIKAFTYGDTTYIPQKNLVGYVDQGTISSEAKWVQVPKDMKYKKVKPLNVLTEIYKKIPQGDIYLTPIGLSLEKGGADWQKNYEISFNELVGLGRNWMQKGSSETTLLQVQSEKVKPKIDKYQSDINKENQLRFEDLYAKDIIYGNITPENAEKMYAESESYATLKKKYGKGYSETLLDATSRKSLGNLDFAKQVGAYGSKKWAYGLGDFALSRIETPKKVLETTAVVGGAVVTYGAITGTSPVVASAVNWGMLGAGGGYGVYEILKPNATPTSAFGGAVLLGTSVAFAGFGAYKHLRSPHITRVKIKAPKMDLKASATFGDDITVMKDGTVKLNKIVHGSQKLSQTSVGGSRAVVTTKWKYYINSLNKKFNFKVSLAKGGGSGWATKIKLDILKPSQKAVFNPITRGLPSDKIPKELWKISGLRGSPNIVLKKSNYQLARDLLKKYGWSDAQAKASLRYTAPKIYDVHLNKALIKLSPDGSKATATFEHLIKRPVVDVNKALGIKTRGGADLKVLTRTNRELIKGKDGKIFAQYKSTQFTGYTNSKGLMKDWKSVEFSAGKTFGKATDLQKGYKLIGSDGRLHVYDTRALYKDISSISREGALKLKLIKTRGKFNIDINYNPSKVTSFKDPRISTSQSRLYQKIIDLDKGKNVWVKPANIKKTPYSKTFSNDIVDDILKQVDKPQRSVVKNVIAKIEKVNDVSPQSKYYGTGQYEQSVGGLSPKEILQNQYMLKSPIVAPNLKIANIKNIIHQQDIALLTGLKVGTLTALGLKSGLKTDQALKSTLKTDNLLKIDIKTSSALKTDQLPALKTSPALKSQLKSLLKTDFSPISLKSPTIRAPTFRPPTIIKPIIPINLWLKAKVSKKKKKGLSKGFNEFAYLPDFTSRAIGLDPVTITEKQAKKKLKKILTGLEVRRGVRVKF